MSRSEPVLRRALALGLAAGTLLLGVRGTQDAVANGDTRTITIRHMHTKEETTVTFKRDGRYVSEGLEKLNWALRDWRTDEPIRMDPRLFDVAWEVQRAVGSEQPFHVVSAYRSPGTNSMLRRRSRAVAKNSQHMLGKAMDFYLPDTPTARIREAGMRLQRGGVGFYPGAHTPFVHLDAGSVRSWPRMTRDQLVRLFPDEKTVHLPADGKPLGGYDVAMAEVIAGGGSVMGYASAESDEGAIMASGRKSLWAALFGGDDEEADARPTRGRGPAPKPQPTVMAYASNNGYSDSNASDGGRFALASVAPEPATRSLARERAERLAPRAAEPPETQAVAPINAAAAPPPPPPQDSRPALVDAPIPLARPRGLTLPQQPGEDGMAVQVAALPANGGALAFTPQPGLGDQKLILAALPPRRPGEITALTEAVIAGKPTNAPLPPARPAAFASLLLPQAGNASSAGLRGSEAVATAAPTAVPEGKLVTVTHPLPPSRPQGGGVSVAASVAPARPTPTPIEQQYEADRSNLDSLFAAVARSLPPAGRSVTVATARTRTTAPAIAPIAGPSPAAALGFSHAEPSDARTGSFSGPAVRPLPTNFVQN